MGQYYPAEVTLFQGHFVVNFIPILAKLYPKLWFSDKPLNFLIFVETNCELKLFRDGSLKQPLPADILISYFSRSYGWGPKSNVCGFWLFFTPLHYNLNIKASTESHIYIKENVPCHINIQLPNYLMNILLLKLQQHFCIINNRL